MTAAESFFAKRERMISLVFLSGFIIDNLTLTRIDVLWSSLVLLGYLAVAFVAVLMSSLPRQMRVKEGVRSRILFWSPFLAQFALGSLFSGYFVFYTRSASFVSSWLFIVLLGVLFLGNEFFKNYYRRFEFQATILFVAILFFSTLYTPLLLNRMDASAFLVGGGISLSVMALFALLLYRITPEIIKKTKLVLT
ncbi:MAG: hypothetical protein ACYCZ7_00150 [Minisyncoccota bacterium]